MAIHAIKLLMCFLILANVLCLEWYQENNPHFINDPELKELLKNDHTTIKIIKFFTPWCKYCRYMKGFFDGYKQTHQIDEHLKIFSFNCMDTNMRVCSYQYHVSGYPTIVVFGKDGKESTRFSGMYPEQVVYDFITNLNNQAINLGKLLSQQPKTQEKPSELTEKNQIVSQKQNKAQKQQKVVQTNQIISSKKDEKVQTTKLDNQIIELTEKQSQRIQKQKKENENQSSSTFIIVLKYIGYIIGGGIAGYYAFHVLVFKKTEDSNNLNKENQERKYFVDSVQIQPKEFVQESQFVQKNEPEIQIDDIEDENL